METINHLVESGRPYLPYAIGGGAVVVTGMAMMAVPRILKTVRRKYGPGNIKAPRDTPLIYQVKRGPDAPSISPFPIKLETYCRLAKIPYMVDTTGRFSSRDKIPWMTFNDEVVEDSEMCITFLKNKFEVDINSHLTPEQRAVDKMIQIMIDEHLYWPTVLFRWIFHHESFPDVMNKLNNSKMPHFVFRLIGNIIMKSAKGQGIGRHSREEIYEIMMDDFRCLSTYLGDKRFMLGDKMSQSDCSVFGMLCQYKYHHFESPGMKNVIEDNFPNLHQYILRIKEEVWPDWEENLKNPDYCQRK